MKPKTTQRELFYLSPEERKFLEMLREMQEIKEDFMMLKSELLEVKSEMIKTMDRAESIKQLADEIEVLRGYELESKFLDLQDLPEILNSDEFFNNDGPSEDDTIH
jgi:hypothetical protein